MLCAHVNFFYFVAFVIIISSLDYFSLIIMGSLESSSVLDIGHLENTLLCDNLISFLPFNHKFIYLFLPSSVHLESVVLFEFEVLFFFSSDTKFG